MGLVDELQGVRVCMDTAPIIYFIEKNPKYCPVAPVDGTGVGNPLILSEALIL